MRPVDNKNVAPYPFYDRTFDNSTGIPLLHITQHLGGTVRGFTYDNKAGIDPLYNFFRGGFNFVGAVPIGAGAINNTGGPVPAAVQLVLGVHRRPGIPNPAYIPPPGGQTSHIVYQQTYQIMPGIALGVPNRDNSIVNVTINARIQAINVHTNNKRYLRLRILLLPEEAAELARIWQDDQWNGTAVLANVMGGGAVGALNAATLRNTWIYPELSRDDLLNSGYIGYRGAKKDLVRLLGKYCSYCESRHQDGQNLAIEHRITKGDYHTEYLRWDNFVLGCDICNSNYKGINPSRTFGINQAMAVHHPGMMFGPLMPNAAPIIPATGAHLPYHQILGAAQNYHLWPDVSDMVPGAAANPASLSLRLCNYQLHQVDNVGNSLVIIPIADAVNLNNKRVRVSSDQTSLIVNVWNTATGALSVKRVQVRIAVRNLNTGTVAFDNCKNTATQNTITLVGLNQVGNPVGDQRMLERTEAWFKAIKALKILQEQFNALARWQNSLFPANILGWNINPAPAIQLTNDQWESICENAEQTGFYSVWVTVFKQYNHNLAQELVTRLNNRATADPNNLNRYHGTNIANSVIPYIPQL